MDPFKFIYETCLKVMLVLGLKTILMMPCSDALFVSCQGKSYHEVMVFGRIGCHEQQMGI